MKIALYCPNKPLTHPHPSGDLTIAQGLRHSLNGLGHDCREIVQFRSRWFWTTPMGWAGALKACVRGLRSARGFRPDIWLTYHTYYKSPDVLGPWISRAVGAPYVLFQPMYSTRRRRASETRTGFYLNRLALKTAHSAFTNNLDDLEALRRILPPARISYLPPGIFPESFERDEEAGREVKSQWKIPPDIPLLMTAARLRPGVKFLSMMYLLRSLRRLAELQVPFMLLAVGDGPMENELRLAAEGLLPGRVTFTGGVDRNEMARYYSAADLFVFPGIGESLGMVFLEAQACGLPVVALDTAGVPQVVKNGSTAFLVEEDGGRAMALAVAALLGDPGMRRVMSAAAARFVRDERNLHANYLELSTKLSAIAGTQG